MLGSSILDVAIGMIFLYLLLSLIASALQEIIASVIQARSANLYRGLRSLFSGDHFNSGKTFVELLYGHGLVRGLYQDPDKDYGPNHQEPAHSRKLRYAFGWARLLLRRVFRMQPPGVPLDPDDLLLPAYIPSRVFALAVRDILNDPKPFGWDSLRNMEENLTVLRAKYKDNKAVEALLALVIDAAGDPVRLQANLENWYSDAMDRVSGWYKRYVQNVLLAIGLILAIGFNVNSVRVARALWVDKDARAALATAAGDYLANHPNPPTAPAVTGTKARAVGDSASASAQPSVDPNAGPAANGGLSAPTAPTAGGQPLVSTDLQKNLSSTVGAFKEVAESSLLPIGWKHSRHEYWMAVKDESFHRAPDILLALVGWIITAAALSFGAPFWFDTLNKFMVVRSTIKPQEKSQVEPSKD